VSEHSIELTIDARGSFSELADVGMWDTKQMRLVGLPAHDGRPSTLGVLAQLPNDQVVYVEAQTEMLWKAVNDARKAHARMAGNETWKVTLGMQWPHGPLVASARITVEVRAKSVAEASSVATTMLRTFYHHEITDVSVKRKE